MDTTETHIEYHRRRLALADELEMLAGAVRGDELPVWTVGTLTEHLRPALQLIHELRQRSRGLHHDL